MTYTLFAEIILPQKVGSSAKLIYDVPKRLQNTLKPGDLVSIPLKKHTTTGIVWKLHTHKPIFPVKAIQNIQNSHVLSSQQLKLIAWLEKKYPGNMHRLVKFFIPKYILEGKIDVERSRSMILKPKYDPITLFLPQTREEREKYILETIKNWNKKNGQLLVMTPEIFPLPGWTKKIPKNINWELLSSKQTPKQKAILWKEIAENKVPIIIASRFGVLAPFGNLGKILLLNEHDDTYSEGHKPPFHSKEVAKKLRELTGCSLTLESTFPKLETYFLAQEKGWTKVQSPRIKKQTTLIDMRRERENKNYSPISEELKAAITAMLISKEQAILFLNRRGSAGALLCRDCGYIERCEECQLPLIVHETELQCHHCKQKIKTPSQCKECQGPALKELGAGTESIENEIQRSFPQTLVARIDNDTIKKPSELEQICDNFKKGEIDILIGTQKIRPDLDLGQVGLIAFVMADTTLTYPDPDSSQKMLQLLTGMKTLLKKEGKMLIQTFLPQHPVYNAFKTQSYSNFFYQQRESKKLLEKDMVKKRSVKK